MAIRALSEYAETLQSLQQQAAQILSNALSAQQSANSAAARLTNAESCYGSANNQYWYYRSRVDVLEVELDIARAAGEHAASVALSNQVVQASAARDAAWSARAVAESDIQSAQSSLNSAREDVANQQAAARSIAAERESAGQTLIALLASASEFVVGKRSWFDRVEKEFVSVADFQWRAADRTIRSTGRSLIRVGGEVDSFARAHAEEVRNVSDIVNHYANDVSEIAGKVAPDFAALAIAVDMVSASLPPPADAVGVKIGAEIGASRLMWRWGQTRCARSQQPLRWEQTNWQRCHHLNAPPSSRPTSSHLKVLHCHWESTTSTSALARCFRIASESRGSSYQAGLSIL